MYTELSWEKKKKQPPTLSDSAVDTSFIRGIWGPLKYQLEPSKVLEHEQRVQRVYHQWLNSKALAVPEQWCKEPRECFQSTPHSPTSYTDTSSSQHSRLKSANQNPAEPHALPSNRMGTSKDCDRWSLSSQDVAQQCSHAALKHFIISSHADISARLSINGRSMINANLETPTSCLELSQNLMFIHLEHQSQDYLLYEKHNGFSGCSVHPVYRHALQKQWRFCELYLRTCRNISAHVASSTILLCRSQHGNLKAGLLYIPSQCGIQYHTGAHKLEQRHPSNL